MELELVIGLLKLLLISILFTKGWMYLASHVKIFEGLIYYINRISEFIKKIRKCG